MTGAASSKVAVLACVIGVVTLHRLGGVALASAGVVLLVWAVWLAQERLSALMRRSRFLFVAMLVLYSFATPGSRLWLSDYLPSPTIEGLSLSLVYCIRLAGLIACVAMLTSIYPRPSLLGAFHACAVPLGRVGFPTRKLVIRAALALELVSEMAPGRSFKDWLTAPSEASVMSACKPLQLETVP